MGQKVNPHGLRVGVIKDWYFNAFVLTSCTVRHRNNGTMCKRFCRFFKKSGTELLADTASMSY